MKSALPKPQPARKPMTPSTLPAVPASAAKTTISTSPIISVFFAPMRLESQLVKNITTPVITR